MSNKKYELLKAYYFRYACKAFDPEKKISDEDFEYILETGRLSPSSFGWEPWQFVVVQNMKLREKLMQSSWGAQRQLPTSSHFVLLLARKSTGTNPKSNYIKHIAEDVKKLPSETVELVLEYYKNFVNKDFDLTDDRKNFDWAAKQVYIPLANMMTAAAHIGIDSCPIEGFVRQDIENILEKEGVVDTNEFGLAVMVAFGYRAKDATIRTKTRQTQDKVVKWIK